MIPFDFSSSGAPGELIRLSPLVRRMVAGNAGPMTFTGTCTYIIGSGEVTVIDPGPNRPEHIAALLGALGGETIKNILVTHTHKDHSPAAKILKAATGAKIFGCPPYEGTGSRQFSVSDAANDREYAPDLILRDGETVISKHFSLVCVETPGHARNHLAYALPEENALFSGDHVMAWSTSVVVPPDGAMGAYMSSLLRLLERKEEIYWPGHGGPIRQPRAFVRALIAHRRAREKSILAKLGPNGSTIPAIVEQLYPDLSRELAPAARLTVYAHLKDLIERGLAQCDSAPSLSRRYERA